MREQYPQRQYSNTHSTRHRKKRRKRRNDIKSIVFLLCFILIVVLLIVFLILRFTKNKNDLVGIWVYDEYTQLEFDESGQGRLLVDNISYEYTYQIEGDKVSIDFAEDVIRDCDYTFAVNGSILTLKGGTGTDGGTYTLNKQ